MHECMSLLAGTCVHLPHICVMVRAGEDLHRHLCAATRPCDMWALLIARMIYYPIYLPLGGKPRGPDPYW